MWFLFAAAQHGLRYALYSATHLSPLTWPPSSILTESAWTEDSSVSLAPTQGLVVNCQWLLYMVTLHYTPLNQ